MKFTGQMERMVQEWSTPTQIQTPLTCDRDDCFSSTSDDDSSSLDPIKTFMEAKKHLDDLQQYLDNVV